MDRKAFHAAASAFLPTGVAETETDAAIVSRLKAEGGMAIVRRAVEAGYLKDDATTAVQPAPKTPTHAQIAARAFEMAKAGVSGTDADRWLAAEAALKAGK